MKSVFRGLQVAAHKLERSLQKWEDRCNNYSARELYQEWTQLLEEDYDHYRTKRFFDRLSNDWRSLYGTAPWNMVWAERLQRDLREGFERAFTSLSSALKPLAITLGAPRD